MSPHTSTNAQSWLHLRGVSLRLGGRLFLRDFDWSVNAGEQWAILGPNGAGKTVLTQLLGAALHPSGGVIGYAPGFDPLRDIGWVSFELQKALCEDDSRHDISEFMDSAVDPGTTVQALLTEAADTQAEVAAVANRLGISALLQRGLRFLSSGEMRRTLIARALLARPRMLVLDNPYEGIDAESRRIVTGIIEQLLQGDAQVLLLTRRPADIAAGITHVLLLDQGRLLAAGRREQVLADPAMAALFGVSEDSLSMTPIPPALADDAANWPADAPLIELRNVQGRYAGTQVFADLDLRLERGEHLCIAGPNGCGKSTLLSLICGDNPRAYGQQLRICGQLRGSGETIWALKQRFGIVSNQLHMSYPKRSSAFAVVASGFFDTLGLYDECGPAQQDIARQWLRLLGLQDRRTARFDELSFGEQRMMLIARAMVKSPPLLILDEPCSGLDERNRKRVLALIDRIASDSTTQILYVSHETEEMPACITRRLEFRRNQDGVYRLINPADGSDR